MRHPEFSTAEWDNAPTYGGMGLRDLHRQRGTTILDFSILETLANYQEESGAFRTTTSLNPPKAPLKLGDVPAAFLKIGSRNEDDYLIHNSSGPEVLVVINGVISLKNSRFASIADPRAGTTGALGSGDVVALDQGDVRLTAHGLQKEAAGLALSIMGMDPQQTELIVIQDRLHLPKEIPSEGRTPLPYED